jgi:predicted PurR-regulated permease PerM
MATNSSQNGSSELRVLIGMVIVVGILYAAKPVFVPLALAVLLAFILTPIVTALQNHGLRRVPAALLVVVTALGLFGAVGWSAGLQINALALELPQHKEKIRKKIDDLRGTGEGGFAQLFQMVRDLDGEPKKPEAALKRPHEPPGEPAPKEKEIVVRPEEPTSLERVVQIVAPVLEPLTTAVFVIIMVVFMLINREDLRNRLIGLLGHGHLTGTTRAIVDAAQRVSSFLLTQLLINIAFGVVVTIGLLVIGVPYAFLWGFLIAVLRFIPYIGTWLGASFPLAISFAMAPDWTQPIVVLAFITLLDLVTANVIEPVLFGHNTGVTPIALLIAAAFWTWIWGPIGLVLATPLTVCLVVLGQHAPRLRFLAVLLGTESPLKPHLNLYQRLLAKDLAEAKQVAIEHAKAHGLESLCDDVLLPSLVLARRDREQDGLTAEELAGVFQSTKEIMTSVMESLEPTPAADGDASIAAHPRQSHDTVLVLGCPAHHEAEELSLDMLALLLKSEDCRLEIVSTKALPLEVEDRISTEKPAVVFIPIMPPGGFIQARYLCRRLRRRFRKLPIVVGCWDEVKDFDQLLGKLRAAGATYVTTSLAQTRSQIDALVERRRPQASTEKLQPAGSL